MNTWSRWESAFGEGLLLDCMARRLPGTRGMKHGIAVYTPGHLGDVLHAVPMLRALRQAKPSAKIHWLVGPWSEALARRYSGLADRIRVLGPNLPCYTRGKRAWRQGLWHQWRTAMDLRQEKVEFFIGAADGMGRFIANALRPGLWVGIGEWRPPRVRPEIQTHFQPYEKDRYEADALAGLLRSLGVEATVDRLEYVVTSTERDSARSFLISEKVDPVRPLVVIAPGSGWSGKNWFPERFGEVASWLKQAHACQVAWVGGAEERALVPGGRAADFDWTGRTSLPLLGAVMEQAKLFVGNDGGLLHLAAALGVPTVSIWGPTSPGKWGPKGAQHRQIRKVGRCEGCIYWDYREQCRHDHVCMEAVAVADVQAAIGEVFIP